MIKHLKRYLRVRAILFSTLLLLGISAATAYMQFASWGPAHEEAEAATHLLEASRLKLKNLRMRVAIMGEAQDLSLNLSRLDAKVKLPASQSELIAETNRFAKRSNVVVLFGDNRKSQDIDGAVRFYQSLTLEGSYANIRQFLSLTKTSAYLTFIDQVDWTVEQQDKQKVRVELLTLFRNGGAA